MSKRLASINHIPPGLTPEELDALADELYDAMVAIGVPSAEQRALHTNPGLSVGGLVVSGKLSERPWGASAPDGG